MGESFKQMQGEKRAAYHARVRLAQAAERVALGVHVPAKRKRHKATRTDWEARAADTVDGFNRDDLGESLDH